MAFKSDSAIKSLNISFSGKSYIIEAFRERIRTYIDGQKWVKRPLVLSPDICAQFGWKCVKSDLLQCVTCAAKLSAHEPRIQNFDAYEACVNKILIDLKFCHKKHCPWPLTPSPECFVTMIPMPKEEALKEFEDRIHPCLEFQSSLPGIAESVISDLGLTENQIQFLCKLVKMDPKEAENVGKSAVLLAATGWTMTSKDSFSAKTCITCESCQRSAWSGFFVANSEAQKGGEAKNDEKVNGNDKQSPKRQKTSNTTKNEFFNPFYEHRDWCLWVSTKAQKSDLMHRSAGSIKDEDNESAHTSGWKVFIRSLLRNVEESLDESQRDSPSKEQIRNVKDMLETWADAES